jgi:two-component system, OmpR family, sensor histidine kinase SenX3
MTRRADQRRLQSALDVLIEQTGAAMGTDEADTTLVDRVTLAAERASEQLQHADSFTARLRGALDWVTEGVIVCDESGLEVYRNAKAVSLAGGRLGDVVAVRAVAEALEAARRGERPEEMLELFSPTRRNLVIRAWPVTDDDGGGLGAVAVVEDVSERRRLESIRRDFVANVSHELKTPVGALSLLAETLDGEEDPEVVSRLAGRVSTEAARLGRIIDDLLDLSRIEVNDASVQEANSLTVLVRQAIDPLRPVADSRQIKIDVTESAPDLVVHGDRRDLISAIGNLVENAVKYSEDHSLVRVVTSGDEYWVTVAVADEGVGIPRREQERIFERFYRVDRARSRSTGGTGLGLSIVRHVVANHGGTIDVESEEGVGSTFRLRLPTDGPTGAAEEPGNA